MRLKCLLSLALVCISVGAADAQTTTFNPSAVPITLDERELQIRVLEGHSRRIAETEREIKELKKKLSTPAVTPKGTPSTKGKKSSPPAVYTPTSTKSFDPISHQQRLRDVINGVPSISAQKTVYQQTQASQSYTVRRGETIEITYPGGGLVQVSVDYSPMRCRTPGGMHLYYAMPDGGLPTAVRVHGMPIDIRSDGACAVCPWSRNAAGVSYEWVTGIVPAADLPRIDALWLRERMPKRVVIPTVPAYPRPTALMGCKHGYRIFPLRRRQLSRVPSFLWEPPEGFEHSKEGQQWIRPPHQPLSQAPI